MHRSPAHLAHRGVALAVVGLLAALGAFAGGAADASTPPPRGSVVVAAAPASARPMPVRPSVRRAHRREARRHRHALRHGHALRHRHAPTHRRPQVAVADSCAQHVLPGHFACFAERRTDVGTRPGGFTPAARFARPTGIHADATAQLVPGGYSPASLQSAYGLATAAATAGAGRRVFVVDAYDDPHAEADLAVYRSQYGLPPCTTANGCFAKLNQAGATGPLPSSDAGWAGEISLDLDMVSAICPNCGITLIEAKDASGNLFSAVKEAATLGAKYVSMSWGGPESGGEATWDQVYFHSTGVVYTASTGDSSYGAGVIYPATSPDVVAVGGTSLSRSGTTRGWTERAWYTSASEGTGSGCSSDEAKPAWQSIVATAVCPRRAASDVSAVADPATGVAVYQTVGGSGWAVYGGTSASAPIIAAVYALAGSPAATAQPASYPYASPGALYDVTAGNNGSCSPALLCTTAAGWDGPTGLGTPHGVTAFAPPAATSPSPTPSPSPTTSSPSPSPTTSSPSPSPTTSSPTSSPTTSSPAPSPTTSSATPTAGPSPSCVTPTLLSPGLEPRVSGWSTTTGVLATTAMGPNAHSGSGYAWLDGYGTTHTDTLSQTLTLPAGCTTTLGYWVWVASREGTTTAYDTLTLTVNGTAVTRLSNVNQTGNYVHRTVSLAAWKGQRVTLTWRGVEDSSLTTAFLLDDLALTTG